MTFEALDLCRKCRENQKNRNPHSVTCAFLHDGEVCDRLLDIDFLIVALFHKEEKNEKIRLCKQ